MSKAKRKGRVGGAGMMVWLFFANLFEPKKVAAMEQIDTQRRIGAESQRPVVGGKPDERPENQENVVLNVHPARSRDIQLGAVSRLRSPRPEGVAKIGES